MARNVNVPPLDEAPQTVVGSTPQSEFAFNFPFWDAADIKPVIDGVELDDDAFTVEGYFVQNGDPVEGGYGSGKVILNTPVSNCTVVIDRFVQAVRESQFARSAPLGMPALNADLNRQVARLQDIVRRAVLTAPGSNGPSPQDVIDAAAAIAGRMTTTGDNASSMVGLDFDAPFELRVVGPTDEAPPDGVYLGSGGNNLSFQTLISSPAGAADADNQRAQLLIATTTTDDGNSEEQSVCLLTTIRTGYSKTWATSTAFSVGDNITQAATNAVYRCIQAGTSAASGTGPSGQGQSITDGTCVWRWINDAAINAKLGIYNEVVVEEGAGSCWAHVNNFHMEAGFNASFACATEIDLTNNTGTDSVAGGLDKYGLWIACQGGNRSTAGLQVSSANSANNALIWGAYFAGTKLASNSVIQVDASSAIGLGFGVNAGGVVTPTFTTATIRDKSIAPIGLSLAGTYSSSAIAVTQPTPAALAISGTKSLSGVYDGSTGPSAVKADGTYSSAAFDAVGTAPAAFASAGSKTLAAFYDQSTSQAAFRSAGTYTTADFDAIGSAPAGLSITGTKTLSGIVENSTAPYAITLTGTYSASPMLFETLPPNYADDAAAAAGGLVVGALYRTGSTLKVRVA